MALVAAPIAASAQPPAGSAIGAPVLLARDDAAARATGRLRPAAAKKAGRFEAPGWVMMRSLVVPGWGQLHNRAWLKAIGVATGEIWMGLRLLEDRNTLNDIESEVNSLPPENPRRNELVDDYNSRLEGYTARQWLLGGIVAYALLDAYVDAHFRDFSIEFEADPALEGRDEPQLRIALRRAF